MPTVKEAKNNEKIHDIVNEIFEEVSGYMYRIEKVLELCNSDWDKLFNNECERLRPELNDLDGEDYYMIFNEYENN